VSSRTVPVVDVDLFGDAYLKDPHAVLAPLRSATPIAYVESVDIYLVTGHDLVTDVLADPITYSNRGRRLAADPAPEVRAKLAAIRSDGWEHRPALADGDPPLHDAFRDVVAPFFTTSRMREVQPEITRICDDLVDRWDTSGPIDFIGQFASPLPLRAIARVLGLPGEDSDERLERFARWRDAAIAAVGTDLSVDELLAAEKEVVAMQHYLAARVESAVDPERDVFAALRIARIVDLEGTARNLTMEEILTIARQIFVGGVETTTNALAELVLQLDGQHERFASLRDAGTRRRILEESLRLAAPAQGITRVTTCTAVLGGFEIPAGANVLIMFAAANRDPAAIDRPDDLVPDRSAIAQHLTFGKGVHVCLGAAFARIEMQAALEVLSRRLRTFRVVDRDAVRYRPSFILRGPSSVWIDVELEPSADRGSGRTP
jgi:cytochrome P450